MKTCQIVLFIIFVPLSAWQCDSATDDANSGISPISGLSASATSLLILVNGKATSVISGGTESYFVTENSNSDIASVEFIGKEAHISGLSKGSTQIKINDNSSSSKSVTISVAVESTFVASSAGSLSFNSNIKNFTANGIAEYSITPPTSGQGAVALLGFGEVLILSYKVNSSNNLDFITVRLISNTSNLLGDYYYPSPNKTSQIICSLDANPNDSLNFSGNGYFVQNDSSHFDQTISVTNGEFDVPILNLGSLGKSGNEYVIIRLMKKIRARI